MKFELWWPIKPLQITQGFGENANNFYKELGMLGHNGLDLLAKDGQMIHAAHDGIVTFTGEDGSGGLGVVVRTKEQFWYKGGDCYFKTIYWHCQKNSFKVKPEDEVRVGDVLALADNTGMSTGTHLHFGLKPVFQGEQDWEWMNMEGENGYKGAIDPRPYFNGFFAEDQKKVISLLESIIAAYKAAIEALKRK